jgi:SAM-dependent methyltransferase
MLARGCRRSLSRSVRPPAAWLSRTLACAWRRRDTAIPLVGLVRFGSLRRLTPISREYGFDRGLPIDRYYIEDFLRRHAGDPQYAGGDITGHVLEVGGSDYVRRFGILADEPRPGKVHRFDVLHVSGVNEEATIIGDLVSGANLPSDTFDCVICTQTLHVIYDVRAALATLYRVLRPGGVALVTAPGIAPSSRPDRDKWGDWWRFTGQSIRRLFDEVFTAEAVTVDAYGNVFSAVAFLHGIAAAELSRAELDSRDPDYEVLLAVRAVKSGSS